jgi:hypothetical protein
MVSTHSLFRLINYTTYIGNIPSLYFIAIVLYSNKLVSSGNEVMLLDIIKQFNYLKFNHRKTAGRQFTFGRHNQYMLVDINRFQYYLRSRATHLVGVDW